MIWRGNYYNSFKSKGTNFFYHKFKNNNITNNLLLLTCAISCEHVETFCIRNPSYEIK